MHIFESHTIEVLLGYIVREIEIVSKNGLVPATFGLLRLEVMEVHVLERSFSSPRSRFVSSKDGKGRFSSRMEIFMSQKRSREPQSLFIPRTDVGVFFDFSMNVNVLHFQVNFVRLKSSHGSNSHDVVNERHVFESQIRSMMVNNGSLFNNMVSREFTSFSTCTLSAIARVGVEVSSHSVNRVSDIVHEVCVRFVATVHRLHKTGVDTSSSDRILNNIILAATCGEVRAIGNTCFLLNRETRSKLSG